ncbi:hypothetical protein [Hymenobacter crusticola]|nr:hypothetical protein [Hymenobacter crusticola]
MNHVLIDGKHYKLPATWNELSAHQLQRVVTVLHTDSYDQHHQRLRLLCVLLDERLSYVNSFTVVQQLQLTMLVDFLLTSNDLTAQLLPTVRVRGGQGVHVSWKEYHGPREYLRNLTFAEFVFADSYCLHYLATKDRIYLHKMLAVLYRPQRHPYKPKSPGYGGDIREDFNEHLIAERAEKLATLDDDQKLAILTWYRGCRTWMERQYPLVFQAGESQDGRTSDWGRVLRDLSGKQFGTMVETGRTLTLTILAQMQDDNELAERLREQAEATKNKS